MVLFLIPFVIVFRFRFRRCGWRCRPSHRCSNGSTQAGGHQAQFRQLAFLFTDACNVSSYLYSLKVAAISTVFACCSAIDGLRKCALESDVAQRAAHVDCAAVLDVVPASVYAWIGLLKSNGVINNVLMSLGIIHEPITMCRRTSQLYRYRLSYRPS